MLTLLAFFIITYIFKKFNTKKRFICCLERIYFNKAKKERQKFKMDTKNLKKMGLTEEEVEESRKSHGQNVLTRKKQGTRWSPGSGALQGNRDLIKW